jgi:hypothetical protein
VRASYGYVSHNVCLAGVHRMIGVYLMGVYLMGVYPMGVHLMGVHLTGASWVCTS